jgi:hypothetical protein
MNLYHAPAQRITARKNTVLVTQWGVNVHNIVFVNNAKITVNCMKVHNK